jgi:hypothetical protein
VCVCVCVCVCLTVCDLETSTVRRLRPKSGCCATEKTNKWVLLFKGWSYSILHYVMVKCSNVSKECNASTVKVTKLVQLDAEMRRVKKRVSYMGLLRLLGQSFEDGGFTFYRNYVLLTTVRCRHRKKD